jgi:hypothetical protein
VSTVPLWAWLVIIVGVAGMLAGVLRALPRSSRPSAAVTLGLWLALICTLAANRVFTQDPAQPSVPWIGPVIVVALLLSIGGLRAVDDLRGTAALADAQTFRVVGVVFLALMIAGELPAVFALPAGLGDLAIGLAAPFVARRLRNGDTRGARTFHVLGIVDLVVAVAIGFLAAPGPFGVLSAGLSTAPLTVLPLVLIPTTLVPLSVAVHLHGLSRLRSTTGSAALPAAVAL